MPTNKTAYLDAAATPLRIAESPMPEPGPNDITIRNRALAINPLDVAQAASGYMVKKFPHVLGHDIAGEVYSVGANVTRFKPGDRVVGKSWGLMTGQAQDSGFALYTNMPIANAALLPDKIAFTDAVVLPLALDTAVCGLFTSSPGMGLDWPRPKKDTSALPSTGSRKVVVVYGASSSVGSAAVQLAAAAGCKVVGIASKANESFLREAGAEVALDYRNADIVDQVIQAIGSDEFVGIYDSIGTEASHKTVAPVLEQLKKGVLCTTKALPEDLPAAVQTKRMFGIGDFAFPLWENFVPEALSTGVLKCLPPPLVVGKGLECLQPAMEKLGKGVSAQKVVVEV